MLQLALLVLSFLEPKDLLRAAQTCRNWRFLAEDNLLWREKCRAAGITRESPSYNNRRVRHRSPSAPQSPWKVLDKPIVSVFLNKKRKSCRSETEGLGQRCEMVRDGWISVPVLTLSVWHG